MSITTLYAELVVVGTGTAIFILLLFYSLFGDVSWIAKLKSLNAIHLIPALSVIYLLGIIIANLTYKVFEDLEKRLRIQILKEFDAQYEEIRNLLYTLPDTKDLVEEFEFRRSKVRICRGWFLNSILIIVALTSCLLAGKIPCPVAWFWIITVGLVMVGSRISWSTATRTELEWFKSFADQQVQKKNIKKKSAT